MEVTLEQVELLREKAGISYTRARDALESTGGNMLDALIWLEEQGYIPRPEDVFYSTREDVPPEPAPDPEPETGQGPTKTKVAGLFTHLRRLLLDNGLEISRHGHPIMSIPLLVLFVLLLALNWIALPLVVISLCLGVRYRFTGPDLEQENAGKAAEPDFQAAEQVRSRHREARKESGEPHGAAGEPMHGAAAAVGSETEVDF